MKLLKYEDPWEDLMRVGIYAVLFIGFVAFVSLIKRVDRESRSRPEFKNRPWWKK